MDITIGGKVYTKTSQTIIPNDNRRLVHRIEICDTEGNSKTFLGSATSTGATPLLIQVQEAVHEAERDFQYWKKNIIELNTVNEK